MEESLEAVSRYALLLFVGALAIYYFFFRVWLFRRSLRQSGRKVTGKVITASRRKSSSFSAMFTDHEGATHTKMVMGKSLPVGAEVTFFYDPSMPDRFFLEEDSTWRLFALVLGASCLGTIINALVEHFFPGL